MQASRYTIVATALFAFAASKAPAATHIVALTGVVADFTHSQFDFSGLHFDNHALNLSGLDSSDSFAVAQGDTIDATVTLDQSYTIPASAVRTDFLQFFRGSAFPPENTGVTGTFEFFAGSTLVRTFGYSSTTSGALASFAAIFPPANTAFTFDRFTNNLVVDTLATPATIDSSSLSYSLVSGVVPEPAAWALMLGGFGVVGSALRRRRSDERCLETVA